MAYIYQRPGETVHFDFSFSAEQEQSVQVFLGGAEVANRNSDGNKSTYAPGKNSTDKVFQYTVRGFSNISGMAGIRGFPVGKDKPLLTVIRSSSDLRI